MVLPYCKVVSRCLRRSTPSRSLVCPCLITHRVPIILDGGEGSLGFILFSFLNSFLSIQTLKKTFLKVIDKKDN